jgi:hypothetical protein
MIFKSAMKLSFDKRFFRIATFLHFVSSHGRYLRRSHSVLLLNKKISVNVYRLHLNILTVFIPVHFIELLETYIVPVHHTNLFVVNYAYSDMFRI